MANLKGIKKLKSDNTNDLLRLSGSDTEVVSTAAILLSNSTGTFTFSGNVFSGISSTDLYIRANTSDTSDNKTTVISGGGFDGTGSAQDRGSYLVLAGNENALTGALQLFTGNNAAADATIGAKRNIILQTNFATRLTIDTSGNLIFSSSAFAITANTSDGADTSAVQLCGGGAVSVGRGGYVIVNGNEAASDAGWAFLNAGNVSGARCNINASASNGVVSLQTVSTERWLVNSSGHFLPGLDTSYDLGSASTKARNIYGRDFLLTSLAVDLDADVTSVIGTPRFATVANNSSANAFGNVAIGTNGSGVRLAALKTRSSGTDANTIVNSGDGLWQIMGYGADGATYQLSAQIQFQVEGTPSTGIVPGKIVFGTTNSSGSHLNRWTINSAGEINQDGTNGSNIVFNKDDTYICAGTSDGSDSLKFFFCGGGTNSNTRGSTVGVYGNEVASVGGQLLLRTGDVSTGNLVLNAKNTSASIQFQGNDTTRWQMLSAGTLQPSVDNTYDIGTSSLAVAKVYSVELDPQRIVFTNASNGDIYQSTSDGSDNKRVRIGGGGDVSTTRGAFAEFYGNESTQFDTNGGQLILRTGDVSTGHLILNAKNTSATIKLQTADTTRWSVNNSGQLLQDPSNGGDIVFGSTTAAILQDTSDGSDTKTINITAANSVDASGIRSALIRVRGNEFSGAGGVLDLQSGNASSANINLSVLSTNGSINFKTNAGTSRWSITSSGTLSQDPTNGGDIVFGQGLGLIRQNTSDGSDTNAIFLCGGGDRDPSRGGFVVCYGNENGAQGEIKIIPGNNGSTPGKVGIYNSNSGGSNALAWSFDNSSLSVGNLVCDATNGGDIVFNKEGKSVLEKPATGLSGAGTTQGAATVISATIAEITTISAGSAEAFRITGSAGKTIRVFNRHATAAAKIFPSSGSQIDALGTNNVYSLPALTAVFFTATTNTQWYSK